MKNLIKLSFLLLAVLFNSTAFSQDPENTGCLFSSPIPDKVIDIIYQEQKANTIEGQKPSLSDAAINIIVNYVNGCKLCKDVGFDRPVSLSKGAVLCMIATTFNSESLDKVYYKADFSGAFVKSQRLEGAYLKGAFLKNAIFAGTWLHSANLDNANIEGVDFTSATLKGASMDKAVSKGAVFKDAKY